MALLKSSTRKPVFTHQLGRDRTLLDCQIISSWQSPSSACWGQPTKVPSKHQGCINLQSLHGLSTLKHLCSKGTHHSPTLLPDQHTVKLCCTTSLPGSQHNRMLERRSETETCWIFSMRTSLPKRKRYILHISSKSCYFVLCFGKRLLTALSPSCTILMVACLSLPTPIYRGCMRQPGGSPLLFAWPWADTGCGTVQMNN